MFPRPALLVALVACTPGRDRPAPPDAPGTTGTADAATLDAENGVRRAHPSARADARRDVLATAITVDVATLQASARIRLAPSPSEGASFEVEGLAVTAVTSPDGPLDYRVGGGRLDVGVPADGHEVALTVTYRLAKHPDEGLLPGGSTLLWPYHCGQLFPCRSDPADGVRFELVVTGAPAGEVVVYPATIPEQAPPYMLAWATGPYEDRELGTTRAGTRVGVWWLPGGEADAVRGSAHLLQVFEWLESTLGRYRFGPSVGSVAVRWRPGTYGGMEHHPYWHLSVQAMGEELVHAHEAAHGWFGDGVRLGCWEDFVLSEGTASYLAARAIEAVRGPEEGERLWRRYRADLLHAVARRDAVAWPTTCGAIDILKDGLFSSIPYMKGAHFLRAVEKVVGRDALDRALAGFYARFVGQAAHVQDLLDAIEHDTDLDPAPLAQAWLRELGVPDDPPPGTRIRVAP